MGDGGSGGDPGNRAQNINENLGKMLRIDVNSTVAPYYTSPATNPYVGVAGNDEIWAIGLRNPWKFSFNRLNGDLWIADVGQGAVEEIDKVVNPLTAGLNFGWRCYEGNSTYNTTSCLPASSMTFPFAQYARTGGACSITGGYFYTGSMYPNFQNKYFFTDYCDDKIRMVNSAGVITTTTSFTGNNIVTFGEDINGELYVAGISSGTIYKVIDSSLGTSDFEKNGFSLYPNPAKDAFTIKSSIENVVTKIELFDITGKLLLTKELDSNPENTIATSSLSKGIYMISVATTNGTSYSSKLIIE
jgi:glucose/arabinose dehydrogenase